MRSALEKFWKVPFVRDVATMQVGRVIAIGSSFLSSILYARFLGLSGFGLYAVVLAFVGTFGIITNLGQQATLITFFAESYGKKDKEGIRIVSHYYVTLCLIASCILGLIALVAPTITELIYEDRTVGQLARLVFLSSFFEFPFSYVAIALQVTREIRLLTIAENAKIVLQLGLSVLLLTMGYGVAGVLMGSVLGAACFVLFSFIAYPRIRRKYNLPSFKEMAQPADTTRMWKHWKDGFWIAIDKNIGNLYPNIFLFVLSLTSTQAIVGLVRLAFKLGNLPASLVLNSVSRLSTSVLPAVASRGKKVLKQNIRKLVTHSVGLMFLATIGALVCVPFFLPLVYGEHFKVAAYPFAVIAVLHLSFSLHTFTTPILRMYSKIYIASMFNIMSMIASLVAFFVVYAAMSDKPTWALYAALLVYHIASTMIIIPTWNLINTQQYEHSSS